MHTRLSVQLDIAIADIDVLIQEISKAGEKLFAGEEGFNTPNAEDYLIRIENILVHLDTAEANLNYLREALNDN